MTIKPQTAWMAVADPGFPRRGAGGTLTPEVGAPTYYYRPQGQVMFSQASVSHSVHNRPHGYSVTAHPCYGAVSTHPTECFLVWQIFLGENCMKMKEIYDAMLWLLFSAISVNSGCEPCQSSHGPFTLTKTYTKTGRIKWLQYPMALVSWCSIKTSIQFYISHFYQSQYRFRYLSVWTLPYKLKHSREEIFGDLVRWLENTYR